MKRTLIFAAIAIAAVAFKPETQRELARVNRVSGVLVFLESQPVNEYEVLGTVKKGGIVWNGKAKEMRDILVRRALKDYPNAEGIIFDDVTMDHATVVKFK